MGKLIHTKAYHPMTRDLIQLILNLLMLNISYSVVAANDEKKIWNLGLGLELKEDFIGLLQKHGMTSRRITQYPLWRVIRGVDDEVIIDDSSNEEANSKTPASSMIRMMLNLLYAYLKKSLEFFDDDASFYIFPTNFENFSTYVEKHRMRDIFIYEQSPPLPLSIRGIYEASLEFGRGSTTIDPFKIEARKLVLKNLCAEFSKINDKFYGIYLLDKKVAKLICEMRWEDAAAELFNIYSKLPNQSDDALRHNAAELCKLEKVIVDSKQKEFRLSSVEFILTNFFTFCNYASQI